MRYLNCCSGVTYSPQAVSTLLNAHCYFLTGMQVLSNPLITACEQTEVMNSTGEFTAESATGMMANDTAGGVNETCIRCGKIDLPLLACRIL